MNILEFLFATDFIWGGIITIYVIVALPIAYVIIKKRDMK